MTSSYYIDEEVECLILRCSGSFTLQNIISDFHDISVDRKYKSGMSILCDYRLGSLDDELGYPSVKRLAKYFLEDVDANLGKSKVAYVVNTMREFKIFHQLVTASRWSEVVERKAFRKIGQAEYWLGIPQDYVANMEV